MRKAGDIITALFRERFSPQFMETAWQNFGLFSSWKAIVEEAWPASVNGEDYPAAAVHSQIAELERGVLLIEADHPGWVQILQMRQRELLSAVQRRFPQLDIRGIAFRLSRGPFALQEENEPRTSVDVETPADVRMGDVRIDTEASSGGHNATKDRDFYAALRGLEESINKRNNEKRKKA